MVEESKEKRRNGISNQEGATSQSLDQKVYWSPRETANQWELLTLNWKLEYKKTVKVTIYLQGCLA